MLIIRHSFLKPLNNQKGMTLIEVIVASSITAIILAGVIFILLTFNRTYFILMRSYDINFVQTMVLEHIKERGVANAVNLTLLEEERQNHLNDDNTNLIKWQDNSLYFNNKIVYRTSIKDEINVYFTNHDNTLRITVMENNNNYITSDIYLHNLNNGLIQEEGNAVNDKFTIFEWSSMPPI